MTGISTPSCSTKTMTITTAAARSMTRPWRRSSSRTSFAFKREGYVPDRDFVVALTSDEESGGSNGVGWLLENHPGLIQGALAINEGGYGLLQDGQASGEHYSDCRENLRHVPSDGEEPRRALVPCPEMTMQSTTWRRLCCVYVISSFRLSSTM